MTALRIECLAANAPARRFYEALGGRLVGERLFDEEGVMLPGVVYEWAEIETLVANQPRGMSPKPRDALTRGSMDH